MGINQFSAALASVAIESLPGSPTVLELGSQELSVPGAWLRDFAARCDAPKRAAVETIAGDEKALPAQTAGYYAALGAGDYQSVDINGQLGSHAFDLNLDVAEHYGFTEQFDLVTNNGTTEHLFNQQAAFANIHRFTKPGGLMLHAVPSLHFVNHCFFNYSPVFFYSLAVANAYEMLALGFATQQGNCLVAAAPAAWPALAAKLPDAKRIDFAGLFDRPRYKGRLTQLKTQLFGASKGGKLSREERLRRMALGQGLAELQSVSRDIMVFALMRRGADESFKTPFQERYRAEIADQAAAESYSVPQQSREVSG